MPEPAVDFARVMRYVHATRKAIEPHDSPERLAANGVEVVSGRGRFVAPGQVRVGERVVRFRAALVATGSRPMVPAIEGLASAEPLTSDTVWDLDSLPTRLLVLGGGPIGCELGQAFARLGSSVTLVEALGHLLPGEHADVGRALADRFAAEGMRVLTGARVVSVAAAGSGSVATLDDGRRVEFDRVLVAAGRTPNTSGLGLEDVGVQVGPRGHVLVDDLMATTGDRIFAAGDVTGLMPFTHVAANQARLVVTNSMLRTRRRFDSESIPWAVFTDPEVARVGIDASMAELRWPGKAVVQRFDHSKLDRAITHSSTEGWVELVADPKRRLVGATIVGPAAGESIAEIVAWIRQRARVDDVSSAVHAYPTFSEGPSRAADEVLRARYFDPKVTRLSSRLLTVLRSIDKPRTAG